MALFASTPVPCRLSLRVLAHLLRYPDAELRAHLPELQQALSSEAALPAARLAELQALLRHLAHTPALQAEATYVELFDRGRQTALHLFEHVHGDSRARGPAMVDLVQTYEQAGLLLAAGELPDYLPVLLEFASTQPPAKARAFLGEVAHIVRAIFSALQQRNSAYASVLAAVLELAGESAEALALQPEAALDESWAEPAVFGGCSTAGQASPGAPQPLRFVRQHGTAHTGEQA